MTKRSFSAFILATCCVVVLSAQDPLVVNPDGSVDANGVVRINDKLLVNNVVVIPIPIGGVVAWYKKPGLVLPSGFVECNGQTVADPESPFYNQVIPDMNGATGGTSRFIRGATDATVGTLQDDAFQGHSHNFRSEDDNSKAFQSSQYNDHRSHWLAHSPSSVEVISDGVNGPPHTAPETRPKNIALVWIMRVK